VQTITSLKSTFKSSGNVRPVREYEINTAVRLIMCGGYDVMAAV
jgi:hypothetical protein